MQPKASMTVDDFLLWAERQSGRYELLDGVVYGMAPERAGHARSKVRVHRALEGAIAKAGSPCEAMADGMTVRIDQRTAYEPNAQVYCGARLPGDAVEVSEPVIVVEVLSPSTGFYDRHDKLAGYLSVPSIQHYLIVNIDCRVVIHHRRDGDAIATRIIGAGSTFRLDPPGLDLAVDEILDAG